ncbi:hypothetical protein B0H14DRAFT_2852872 [Mycena olivaceomarginata]|nr:hypothetical protein B0H14DRAFT_2852872 [Mycena olivaceomarginata]
MHCPMSSRGCCVSLLTAIMIIFAGSSAPVKSDPVTMNNLKLNSHPSRSGAKAYLVCNPDRGIWLMLWETLKWTE